MAQTVSASTSYDSIKQTRNYELLYGGALAVFVTFVLLTNTVGMKLFTVFGITLPVAIIWYPLTFLITDITSEIYGAKRAQFMVVTGFSMSVILLVFSLIGMALPAASFYPLDLEYKKIYGPVWRLLFASMTAYMLAQMIDVRLFHFWKKLTKGRHLWLRNNASTMVSQFVDTATVNFIFLYKNPLVFSGTLGDLGKLILTVYVIKILIAAVDTPFCYLGVWFAEKVTGVVAREVS